MKISRSFTVFVSLLCCAVAFSCGPYYPFGEDARFSIFNRDLSSPDDFRGFMYSARVFMPDDAAVRLGEQENVLLWKKRAGGKLTIDQVRAAIYGDGNAGRKVLITELRKNNDQLAIDYLAFADQCVPFNRFMDDPWERGNTGEVPARGQMQQRALEKARSARDADLEKRYAFLAIRLAFYDGNYDQLRAVYDTFFENAAAKNIVDYWAMYFRGIAEKNPAKANYFLSRVFVHAPDKRFVVNQHFTSGISPEESLEFAVSNSEKAAVWITSGIMKSGRASENISRVQQLDPGNEALKILILREINKLEDWIFTPYYSELEPSVGGEEAYYYSRQISRAQHLQRIAKDRKYAAQLLHILQQSNPKDPELKAVYDCAKVYLGFMTDDFDQATLLLSDARAKNPHRNLRQLDLIEAMILMRNQPQDSAVILPQLQELIRSEANAGNNRFIFAIARELEFKGNTTDAAALLSYLSHSEYRDNSDPAVRDVYWKSVRGIKTLWIDAFDDYFFYMDAEFTIPEMNRLITDILTAEESGDAFTKWKFANIRKIRPRLYDLLGTKYMRSNQLPEALAAFQKVDRKTWRSKRYYYREYLKDNPFYIGFEGEQKVLREKMKRVDKPSIAAKLAEHILKGDDENNPDRAYHYFLVANCYYNMSFYGNAWMMKRYYHSINELDRPADFSADEDYYTCRLAGTYYRKAMKVSNDRRFKAFCLRLAGRCESHEIAFGITSSEGNQLFNEQFLEAVFARNRSYQQLRREFPTDYEPLISSCDAYTEYLRRARN